MRKLGLWVLAQALACACLAQKEGDAAFINRLTQEEQQRSQVMDLAFYLTDVNGPRLTASPGFLKAANWAKNKLESWGLKNVQVESWGEFGRGWEQQRCYVAMTKPYYTPLMAIPQAWTGSTPGNGVVNAEVVLIRANDSAALQQYAGKLKNKIIMLWSNDSLKPGFTPDAARFTDEALEKMARATPAQPRTGSRSSNPAMQEAFRNRAAFNRALSALYRQEKPALVLSKGRGNEGTIFVQGGGSYAKDAPAGPAVVTLSSDDFLRLQRLVQNGVTVQIEADVKTKFFDKDPNGYNVIGEIPGTDPALKDDVVMLGAHLDSWQGATGATDNAAGSAVMLEAVRLLKEAGLQPRRTIRIALWGGEEQGLHGSRNYVKKYVGDPATLQLQPLQQKISAYYNLDNGTGRIRGVYLQGNEAVRPIFAQWLQPFHAMGATTLTIANTGGTDHLSFDAVGVPGFQFIQDPIAYDTRTHHSNMDTYDHLVAEDLKQAATIVAAFVFNSAQRDEKLPRKEMPKPNRF